MLTGAAPRERSLRALSPHGFHRVVWYEWGAPDNPRVVICVHGLTRTGRDFDVLGEALAATHRVLAVDMPGRGRSEWLANKHDYTFPVYLSTLTALVASSGVDNVDWVGTSMGGLLGIVMAGMPDSPLRKLVVNDVGPTIESAGLARIGSYIGLDPTFATRDEIARYVRGISPFGALSDAQWDHLIDTVIAQRPDGRYGFRYDPGIAVPFRDAAAPVDLWPLWDAIRCPTLLLRGADSDLLSRATAHEMTLRGARPRLVEFGGVAHAPMLLVPEQVATVVAFLRE
ncbi:MAG TPA: alpha/beta hydrolase [Casimicrobiaceae bacterium]|nr:alpha/beta hydrolase [Casimicrobiaceae bacterium]